MCQGNDIIHGSVPFVGKLKRVQCIRREEQVYLFNSTSCCSLVSSFLERGIMVGTLKDVGTIDYFRERLKMLVNTSASW